MLSASSFSDEQAEPKDLPKPMSIPFMAESLYYNIRSLQCQCSMLRNLHSADITRPMLEVSKIVLHFLRRQLPEPRTLSTFHAFIPE